MTKVTIETISGKQCTVIKKPFDADWVKEQLGMEQTVLATTHTGKRLKTLWNYDHKDTFFTPLGGRLLSGEFDYTITILPALPKHPKPADAPLLYRYMAQGITLIGFLTKEEPDVSFDRVLLAMLELGCEITHATLNGERVEIALGEKT